MQTLATARAEAGHPGLLGQLHGDFWDQVHPQLQSRQLASGETLVVEGEPCPGLGLVESGLVKIFKTSAAGREQVLRLARPGETFADAAAWTGDLMPASVAAVDPSIVLILPSTTLDHLLATDPRFARLIVLHLSHLLEHLLELVADLSFRPVHQRVAKVLLQAWQPQARVGAGRGQRSLTQREIAELAGTTREVVSRTLAAFDERGLIRVQRGHIALLDADGLRAAIGP